MTRSVCFYSAQFRDPKVLRGDAVNRAAQNKFYPRNLEFWVNYGKIQETVRCVLFLAAYLVRKVDSEPNVIPQKLNHHYLEPGVMKHGINSFKR